MRRLFFVACFVSLLPAVAGATDIRSYGVKVVALADGPARVTVTVSLSGLTGSGVAIPVGFGPVSDLGLVDAPAGTTAAAEAVNGQTTIRLAFLSAPADPCRVVLGFTTPSALVDTTPAPGERPTLPEGNRLLRHTFVNTEASTISDYRAEYLFPAGTRAHAVREWSPKLRKGEAGPRVRLADIDGGAGARLAVTRLRQGDSASMTLELVPQSRPWAFLAAGLLLSVLYLVAFRDLVGKPSA